MWIVARYLPVAPLSLKPASATSSGGMTLLVPTPYAIKMALLDAAIRLFGLAQGEQIFPHLRDCSVALALPDDLIVMKGFSKIRRLLKDRSNEQKAKVAHERKHFPMQPTIAYREYVSYRETLQLAISFPEQALPLSMSRQLLSAINYIGKRGGFVQLMAPPTEVETLPERFVSLTASTTHAFHMNGTLQVLYDCHKSLTFQRANIYHPDRITLGKERILHHVVLPYQLHRSSRGYSWYRFIQQEEQIS